MVFASCSRRSRSPIPSYALTFKTSARALLPQDAGYVHRYLGVRREFGELEDIVVVVEAGSFEAAKAYAAASSRSCAGAR